MESSSLFSPGPSIPPPVPPPLAAQVVPPINHTHAAVTSVLSPETNQQLPPEMKSVTAAPAAVTPSQPNLERKLGKEHHQPTSPTTSSRVTSPTETETPHLHWLKLLLCLRNKERRL